MLKKIILQLILLLAPEWVTLPGPTRGVGIGSIGTSRREDSVIITLYWPSLNLPY